MSNTDRNTYVKKQITSAILRLLKKQELSEIGIKDICAEAGVSRNSFYRNYSDKQDILRTWCTFLLKDWITAYAGKADGSLNDLFGDLFAYLKKHGNELQLLQKRNLFYLFHEAYLKDSGPQPEMDNMTAYTTSFMANGILGWIDEWLARGMQESAEVMSEMLMKHGMK